MVRKISMLRASTATRRAASALAGLALVFAPLRPAFADPPGGAAECYDAHETGQLQRKRGELRKARVSFAVCGRTTCPAIVQRDCVAWAAELASQQPSVVIAVVGEDGTDVLGARVWIDGSPVSLDGRALELDPGDHRARIEARGEPPVEQRFAVREGERARRVPIVLASRSEVRRSPPVASYVLGGVAVLSMASFGTFAVLGKSRENELSETCGSRCSDDDVAGVRRSYVAADVSLGVAILAAGAAVVTWVLAPSKRSERVPD